MTRNNKLLFGFFIIVFVPVVVVWLTVWPILRAWTLPNAVSAYENMPYAHSLSNDEMLRLNKWVQSHQTGWGVSGEKPPITKKSHSRVEQRVVTLKTNQGADIIISFWHFRRGDDVAGIQTMPQGAYRMRSFAPGELLPFMKEIN